MRSRHRPDSRISLYRSLPLGPSSVIRYQCMIPAPPVRPEALATIRQVLHMPCSSRRSPVGFSSPGGGDTTTWRGKKENRAARRYPNTRSEALSARREAQPDQHRGHSALPHDEPRSTSSSPQSGHFATHRSTRPHHSSFGVPVPTKMGGSVVITVSGFRDSSGAVRACPAPRAASPPFRPPAPLGGRGTMGIAPFPGTTGKPSIVV